jgi:tRNA U34 5-carboxymethylaminomethyl modifying GTPase MnmE/TrmE
MICPRTTRHQHHFSLTLDIESTSNQLFASSKHSSKHVGVVSYIKPQSSYLTLALAPDEVVLGAEELRYAARAVGKISGLIDVEDVLDSVFRDFCIGK